MNSLKMFINPAKILAFALSFLIFCFSTAAIAAPSTLATLIITEKAQITGGKFSIDTTTPSPLPATTVIRSAKLFLPAKLELAAVREETDLKYLDESGFVHGANLVLPNKGLFDLSQSC